MHLINTCDVALFFSKLLGSLSPTCRPPLPAGLKENDKANTKTRKGKDISKLQCHPSWFHLLTHSLEVCSNMGKLVTFPYLRGFAVD